MPGNRHPSLHALRLLVLISLPLTGCATLPPPTSEIPVAQQALTRADGADSDQYAAGAITQARDELAQAQAAMAKGRGGDARSLAVAAAADADLAYASSNAATTRAEYAQQVNEIANLQQRLQMPVESRTSSPLDEQPALPMPLPPVAGAKDPGAPLAARLRALEGDPQLSGYGAYERLLAHQALDALTAAHGRDRDSAARMADRRIAIAELSARTQATRGAIDRLARERSDLLVEASRRDAEQARQEAERLRMQAQVQAEETERLREQAAADAAARQQAEDVIVDVGASEAAKLKAARDREAALARQEAALMAANPSTQPAPKQTRAPTAGPGKATAVKKKKKQKQ